MAKGKEKEPDKGKEEEIELIDENDDNGDDFIKNKIRIQDFLKKERISQWAARVFIKTLNKKEYSESELKKLYKEFQEEKFKEGVKK